MGVDCDCGNNNIYKLKYICQINSSKKKGIGAFLKIAIDSKPFYCIIANIELNKEELLKLNENIEVNYNNLQNKFIINLKENKRFLRYYKEINITIIQILINIDSVSENYFFLPKATYENLEGEKIYIAHISKDNQCNNFRGEIKKVEENKFIHSVDVKNGFSGNFVFLENKEFIGINLEGKIDDNENYGYFLNEIKSLLMLKDDISGKESNKNIPNKEMENEEISNKMENNNSKEEKIDLTNGNYYIGKVVDGKMHGKGKMHYRNNSIMYEGDFVDNKFEGNGKFIYKDGVYYVGQFKKGEKHGKGILYDKNGEIVYEGDFKNDKIEGEGKIFDTDDYYIGQFEDGKKKGKGKEFYKDGKLKYDGLFEDDLYEGNGKFIYEDGDYYIGQWHKGLQEGKGQK